LIHVHDGDGQMMLDNLDGVNVARLVGVLWDNSVETDCMTETPPYVSDLFN
jgi:hypothetical protein